MEETMQSKPDQNNDSWGMVLSQRSWQQAKDWLTWTNLNQREKWEKAGLVIWDADVQQVTRLSGGQSLGLLESLRNSTEWRQQGCVVGEPAWRISLDDSESTGESVLVNEIALSPDRSQALYDYLVREEEALLQMQAKEEEKEALILARLYDIILSFGEKHTVNDENLSWAENKRTMRSLWESRELPEQLTRKENKILAEVLEDVWAELEQADKKRQERGIQIRKNLLSHQFFWKRIESLWLCLRANERLHILQLLQDVDWDQETMDEIKQLIENAQFFDIMAKERGAAPNPEKLTSEELDLLLDLPDDALWNELLDLYKQSHRQA
jgi:hypothetical protein